MYKIGEKYLYQNKILVTFMGESGHYNEFISDTTKFRLTKYGLQLIRPPFKFIKL